ncbi:MAG: hypothetical protein KC684_01560 [Candidatus Omnitrophica bacterium]|nr:hypothetical protein [Candidatus Omnitrophota bacterium]
MNYITLKKPAIFLGLVTIIFFIVEFFGVIGFFSIAMWLIVPLVMFTVLYIFLVGCRFAISSLRSKSFKGVVIGLTFAMLGIFVFRMGHNVHLAGLTWKFRINNTRLTEQCEKILTTKEPNTHFWDNSFNLWPPLIGPTRKAIFHLDGVVYISFEGGPGDNVGVCYNPEGKTIKGVMKHLFGPWYWFYSKYR